MKVICVALAALALSQVVAGQTQAFSSTLFQTFNSTSKKTGFWQCNETNPIVGISPTPTTTDGAPLTQLKASEAGQVVVDAAWFGGETGPALNFQVVSNCSVLQLTSNGGHGTTIYTGPVPLAPNGCTTSWYQSTNYLHLFVAITNTGFGWSVSLPTVDTVRAQTACNGGYQYCPVAIGVSCDSVLNLPTTLNADGSLAPAAAPQAEPTVPQAKLIAPAAATPTPKATPQATLG